jgi:4-amino-4-deoxy-L-arabinose transferase-like glycosyltransferase
MTASSRKRDRGRQTTEGGRHRTPSTDPQSAMRNPRFILTALALVVFAGIPFALGKYFELKCPDPFDSGSYVYSARHVLAGARVGWEEKPSAQAGTLLMNMLGVELSGYSETGSKLLQGLFQAAAFAFMFITIRRLYGTLAGVVSVTIASIYLSAPVIAKYGNVKEQFMIAFMIMGICSFVWYRLTGKWWWLLLTGALLIWGPMFKQTGVSAIAAVGLFVLAQPILRHNGWKKAGQAVVLLVAGAAITLAPICLWYARMGTPLYYWPYSFAFGPVFKLAGVDLERAAQGEADEQPVAQAPKVAKGDDSLLLKLLPGYVSDSWRMLDRAERRQAFFRVLRYYRVLILPIALALGAIVARVVVLLRRRHLKSGAKAELDRGGPVLLFALWWFFDMSFCFISPHSYEQYYLPLNASSAMLGGYLVGMFAHRLRSDRDKTRWVVLGLVGLIVMLVMVWPIFFGLARWPHNGDPAVDREGRPIRVKGYQQKWQEIASNGKYDWMQVGDYIRGRSEPTDPIYVWGWIPGIYVQAQRMSPAPKAFEGMMHTLPPPKLAARVRELVDAFEKAPPKFIVDTHKIHFPWTMPPLELWPNVKNGASLLAPPPKTWDDLFNALDAKRGDLVGDGFLRPDDPDAIGRYDAAYEKALRSQKRIDPDESLRYEAMRPLREYVMKNYRIVNTFGAEVLFQHK